MRLSNFPFADSKFFHFSIISLFSLTLPLLNFIMPRRSQQTHQSARVVSVTFVLHSYTVHRSPSSTTIVYRDVTRHSAIKIIPLMLTHIPPPRFSYYEILHLLSASNLTALSGRSILFFGTGNCVVIKWNTTVRRIQLIRVSLVGTGNMQLNSVRYDVVQCGEGREGEGYRARSCYSFPLMVSSIISCDRVPVQLTVSSSSSNGLRSVNSSPTNDLHLRHNFESFWQVPLTPSPWKYILRLHVFSTLV